MVDMDCQRKIKMKMSAAAASVAVDAENTNCLRSSTSTASSSSASAAYEHYLRLPELSKLWSSRQFPEWKGESLVKPALQALEITFRFVSITLSDPRPYANHREWSRRLESLATRQLELVASLCGLIEEGAPTCQLGTAKGLLTRDRSSQEVWKIPGNPTPMVSRTSEESLLPRLAAWDKSEGIASKLQMEIECQMSRSPFTLGLGEPNLAGKPILEYDMLCLPAHLHALNLKIRPTSRTSVLENHTVYTTHQILETWVVVAKQLLLRIGERIGEKRWEQAATECWLLERVWKLLTEIEDLHLLMDPDDFLRLKQELGIRATSGSEALCFRSKALVEVAERCSSELKGWVPEVLGVEADPEGGPRLQEAAMRLFQRRKEAAGKIHLLQAFQAVDAGVKKFFFAYRQLMVAVMGSLEAAGGALEQIFTEPPYFPSLDAAKTFLGDLYQHQHQHHPSM